MQPGVPHSHQLPVVVCPAYAIGATGVVAPGSPDGESENQSGRVSMHRVANISFLLKDRPSFKRFTVLDTDKSAMRDFTNNLLNF